VTGLFVLLVLVGDGRQERVRPRATVEVLDGAAEVEDVITRLRQKKPEGRGELKNERPVLPDNAAAEPPPKAEGAADRVRREKRRERRERDANRDRRGRH
jgi:hypothetical protein